MKTKERILSTLVVVLAAMLLAQPAHAYIGPGAGLSALGSLFALLAAAVVCVFGFIWYPIKRVIRMFKSKDKSVAHATSTVEAPRQ